MPTGSLHDPSAQLSALIRAAATNPSASSRLLPFALAVVLINAREHDAELRLPLLPANALDEEPLVQKRWHRKQHRRQEGLGPNFYTIEDDESEVPEPV